MESKDEPVDSVLLVHEEAILAYLLVKFPLGIFTFVDQSTPVIYPLCSKGTFFCRGADIYIDTLWKAISCFFVGLVLFFRTLHIFNGLAWISGRFSQQRGGIAESGSCSLRYQTPPPNSWTGSSPAYCRIKII